MTEYKLPDGQVLSVKDNISPEDLQKLRTQLVEWYPNHYQPYKEKETEEEADLSYSDKAIYGLKGAAQAPVGFARGFFNTLSLGAIGLLESVDYGNDSNLTAAAKNIKGYINADPSADSAAANISQAKLLSKINPKLGGISVIADYLKGKAGINESLLAPNEEYRDSYFNKIPEGLGSAAAFIGTTYANPFLGAALAVGTGIGTQAEMQDAARARGEEISLSQEIKSKILGGVIGFSEIINPLSILKIFRGVRKGDPRAAPYIQHIKNSVKSAGIEGVQETLAGLAQELTAQGIYDPTIEVGESMADDFTVGAIVGAIVGGGSSAAHHQIQKNQALEYETNQAKNYDEEQKASDEIIRQKIILAAEQGDQVIDPALVPDAPIADNYNLYNQLDDKVKPEGVEIPVLETFNFVPNADGTINVVGQETKQTIGTFSNIEEASQAATEKTKQNRNEFIIGFSEQVTSINGLAGNGTASNIGRKLYDPLNNLIDAKVLANFDVRVSDKRQAQAQKEKLIEENEQAGQSKLASELMDNMDTTGLSIEELSQIKQDLEIQLSKQQAVYPISGNKIDPESTLALFWESAEKSGIGAKNFYTVKEAKKLLNKSDFNQFMSEKSNIKFEKIKSTGEMKPVKRIKDKIDVSQKAFDNAFESKNIEVSYTSPAFKYLAETFTGDTNLSNMSIGQKEMLMARIKNLPRFNNKTKLPNFTPRPYTAEQIDAFYNQYQGNRFSNNDIKLAIKNNTNGKDLTPKQINEFKTDLIESGRATKDNNKLSMTNDFKIQQARKAESYSNETTDEFKSRLVRTTLLTPEQIEEVVNDDAIYKEGVIDSSDVLALPSPEPMQKYSELFKLMRKRLIDRNLGDVALKFDRKLKASLNIKQKGNKYFYEPVDLDKSKGKPTAVYDRPLNKIILSIEAINPDGTMSEAELGEELRNKLDHESVHALIQLGILTQKEVDMLFKDAKKLLPKDFQKKLINAYTGKPINEINDAYLKKDFSEDLKEELVAEFIRISGNNPSQLISPKSKTIINKIINFLTTLGQTIYDAGFTSSRTIIRDIESGKIGARERGVLRNTQRVRSRNEQKYGIARPSAEQLDTSLISKYKDVPNFSRLEMINEQPLFSRGPRDESSGHVADFVPAQYGPPAHQLDLEASGEFTSEGYSTASFGFTYPKTSPDYRTREFKIYSTARTPQEIQEEREFVIKLMEIKGNPNATITMYQAAPSRDLRKGDLITPFLSDAQYYVDQSKVTQEEVRDADKARRRQEQINKTGAVDLQQERLFNQMEGISDILGRPSQATPSTIHTYELKAGDVRWDGNNGWARWGYFPSNVVGIDGNIPLFSRVSDIENKYINEDIKLDIFETENEIKLSKIIVSERNMGVGTSVMNDLTNYADINNKVITLTPSKDFGATSVNRLKTFYKRFGFVENKGRNKDFSYRDSMYRLPQTSQDIPLFSRNNIIKLDMSKFAKQTRDNIKNSKKLNQEFPYFSSSLQGMNRDLPLEEQLGKTAEQKEAVNFLLNKNPNTFENFKIGTIIKDNARNMTYQIDRYNTIREKIDNIKPALVVKVLEDKGFQKIYNKGDITQLDLINLQESILKNPNAFTIFTGPKSFTQDTPLFSRAATDTSPAYADFFEIFEDYSRGMETNDHFNALLDTSEISWQERSEYRDGNTSNYFARYIKAKEESAESGQLVSFDGRDDIVLELETREKYNLETFPRVFVMRMPINDFIKLTTPDDLFIEEQITPYIKDNKFDPLEFGYSGDTPFSFPVLAIDSKGQVTGHDGRGRSLTALQDGATEVPVILFIERGKDDNLQENYKFMGDQIDDFTPMTLGIGALFPQKYQGINNRPETFGKTQFRKDYFFDLSRFKDYDIAPLNPLYSITGRDTQNRRKNQMEANKQTVNMINPPIDSSQDTPLFSRENPEEIYNEWRSKTYNPKTLEQTEEELKEYVDSLPPSIMPRWNKDAHPVSLRVAFDFQEGIDPVIMTDAPSYSRSDKEIPNKYKEIDEAINGTNNTPDETFADAIIDIAETKEEVGSFLSRMRAEIIDEFSIPEKTVLKLGKASAKIRELNSRAISGAIQALRMSKKGKGVHSQMMMRGVPVLVDEQGNPVPKGSKNFGGTKVIDFKHGGFVKIIGQLHTTEYGEDLMRLFKMYRIGLRGTRLNKEGKEVVLTPEQLELATEIGKDFPIIQIVSDQYSEYNNAILDYAVQTGILSEEITINQLIENISSNQKVKITKNDLTNLAKEARKNELTDEQFRQELLILSSDLNIKLEADNKIETRGTAEIWKDNADYYPFYRKMADDSIQGPAVAGGFLSGNPLNIEIKGSKKAIEPEPLEVMARNMQSIVTAAMKNEGLSRLMEVYEEGKIAKKILLKDKKSARDLGSDVISVFENGEQIHYQVADPIFTMGLQAFGMTQDAGLFMKVIGLPSNILRESITRDPGFIIKNMLRDTLSSAVTSGANFIPIVDTFKGFAADLSELERFGVIGGYDAANDRQDVVKKIKKIKREQGLDVYDEEGNFAIDQVVKLWDFMGGLTTRSDGSTRKAVADSILELTGDQVEAAYQALEIINFDRRGFNPYMRIVTTAIPFLNARIQGLDVLYRSGTGQYSSKISEIAKNTTPDEVAKSIILTTVFRGGMLTLATLLYYALIGDEERYEGERQSVRDDNWLIPTPDGLPPLKFPIPFEVGFIFKTVPERILDYSMTKFNNPNYGNTTGKQLEDSISRGITTTLKLDPTAWQIFKPLKEVRNNKSGFTGNPIVPPFMEEGIEPYQQYTTNTSSFAIALGDQFNVSPIKIDYLMNQYTGTIGTYLLNIADIGVRKATGREYVAPYLTQLPVVKSLFASQMAGGLQEQYYEMRSYSNMVIQTINDMEKKGRIDELIAYTQSHKGALGTRDEILRIEKFMKQYRADKLSVQISKLSPEEKREIIKQLDEGRNLRLSIVPFLVKQTDQPSYLTGLMRN
jgi:hypothetical protein